MDSDLDTDASIKTLKANLHKLCGGSIIIEDDSFVLLEGFREAYFSAAFEKFRTALGILVDYSLDDFAAGKMWREMEMLKDTYNYTFGDYIWTGYLMPRDEFMRNAKPGVRYYFGGTLDYHWYAAVLKPGDKVMGMSLSAGGHLSHCNPQGLGGKLYDAVLYGVDEETGLIDYDKVYDLAQQHRPKLIVCGASAYPRMIDFAKFREIADGVGAYLLADIAHIAGLVATGLHPSPIPYADFVTTTTHKTLRGPRSGLILCREEFAKKIDTAVFPRLQGGPLMHIIAAKAIAFKEALDPSFKTYQEQVLANAKTFEHTFAARGIQLVTGGTDNHLLLLNVAAHGGPTGKAVEEALGKCNITVNKNTIPGEKLSPNVASGIRIGTPAITTRGMTKQHVKYIANVIANVIDGDNPANYKKKIIGLATSFPLFKR